MGLPQKILSLCILFPGLLWGEIPTVSIATATYPTPFQAGESLLFTIRWGIITGGYSTLSVKPLDRTASPAAYHIISEARSTGIVDTFYHVDDRNEAWMDACRPRSLRYEKNLREGKYRARQIVELNHEQLTFVEQEERLDKNTFERKEGTIPPDVLDVLSSLYYVRTQPLAVGLSYTIDVHSGDKTWPLIVRVLKREHVRVKAGRFDCYKLEPILREPGIFVPKGKKLEVWVTADDRHLPVLMRSEIFIGHVSAELVREQPVLPPGTDQVAKPLLPSGLN